MNWLDRLNQWLASQLHSSNAMRITTRDFQNEARLSANLEQYDKALSILQQAEATAQQARDIETLADMYLLRGDVLFRMGNWDEANDVFKTVCDTVQPQGGQRARKLLIDALCGMGRIAQARGAWEQAQAYYEDARTITQEIVESGVEGRAGGHLAEVYLHEGNAIFALHLLEKTLPYLDESGDADLTPHFMMVMADAYIAIEQKERGRALRHNALFIASVSRQIAMVRHINHILGDDAYERGDFREANTHYHEVQRHLSSRVKESLALTQLEIRRAYCQYKLNQVIRARETLDNFLSQTDKASITHEARLVEAIVMGDESGMTLAEMESLLSRCGLPLKAPVWDVLERLIACYEAESQHEAIARLYEQLLERWQEDIVVVARLQTRMGYLERVTQPYEARRRWTEALKVLQAQTQYEASALLACDLGELHLALGDGRQAENLYEQALLDFSHLKQEDIRGTVASNVGVAYSWLGNPENAEVFLRMALEIAEKTQNTHGEIMRRGNYGVFLAQIGDPKPAIHAIKDAIAKAQATQHIRAELIQQHNLGYVHFLAGHLDNAEHHYQEVLPRLEASAEAYWSVVCRLNQADLYLMQGRVKDASDTYVKAYDEALLRYNKPLDLHRILGVAQIHLHEGRMGEASDAIAKALTDARRCRIPRLLIRALCLQSAFLKTQNEPSEAVESEVEALAVMVKTERWVVPQV